MKKRQPIKDRLTQNTNKNGPVPAHKSSLGKCWEWCGPGYAPDVKYARIWIVGKNGKGKMEFVHRLAYMEHTGKPIPTGQIVCHRCDNHRCVRPGHLYLGTHKDNAKDTSKAIKRMKDNGAREKVKIFQFREKVEDRFWERVDKSNECWEWLGSTTSGYGTFSDGKQHLAHKWIYEHTYGVLNKGQVIMHTCDNRKCVRLEHLVAGTHTENMQDMAAKGRNSKARKLDSTQVKQVWQMLNDGISSLKIAQEFNIAQSTVLDIGNRKSYTYIDLPKLDLKSRAIKLTPEEVRKIRKLWVLNSVSTLAKQFNISTTAIEAIIEGRTWKHLNLPPITKEEQTLHEKAMKEKKQVGQTGRRYKTLTAETAKAIHKLLTTKTVNEIAKMFDVAEQTVADVAYGRTWKWLGLPEIKPRWEEKIRTLSKQDVKEIRRQASTKTIRELAKEYDIGENQMRRILEGKSWKHVK